MILKFLKPNFNWKLKLETNKPTKARIFFGTPDRKKIKTEMKPN